MYKIITMVLIAVWVLSLESGFAQNSKAPGEGGIGILIPSEKTVVTPDNLLSFKLPQGALLSGRRLDSKLLSDSDYEAALEAAEAEPGILIFPDSTVDAKILWIKPGGKVDPKMIVTPPLTTLSTDKK